MSYQPTPYDKIENLLVMMGSLFLKGPEIDLTDLPKIVSRYFCIFGTLEFLKTQKYRRIHENRTGAGNSDRPTCTTTANSIVSVSLYLEKSENRKYVSCV